MASCKGTLSQLSVGLLIMLTGCNLRQGAPVDPEQAVQLGQQVKVYQPADFAGLKYTTLGPIDASTCKFALWDDTPTEQGVTNQLLAKASAMSANGIAHVACSSGTVGALVRDCWSRVACTAEVLKVGN